MLLPGPCFYTMDKASHLELSSLSLECVSGVAKGPQVLLFVSQLQNQIYLQRDRKVLWVKANPSLSFAFVGNCLGTFIF